jgi:DNA-binding NtrC family response regulator
MIKMAPKSTRTASVAPAKTSQGKILYGENDANVLAAQSKVFEQAGYSVERAQGRAGVQQALRTGSYDVVVLGHTLTKDDRHHLPYMAKKIVRDTQVLVLHASGKHPAVDYAMDSREGDKEVLRALSSLMQQKSLGVAV